MTLTWNAAPAPAAEGVGEPFDAARCQSLQPAPYFNDPTADWPHKRLRTSEVHQLATGKGIRIAVVDTGIDTDQNPALTRNGRSKVAASYNFAGYDRSKDKQVECVHGTGVASLIVGHGGGLDGLAPDAEIIGMRALQAVKPVDDSGRPTGQEEPEPLAPTIAGIRKAIELKVDIINISQQGSDSPEYRAAINDALSAGIVVVAASGNHGGEAAPPYPASYRGVIAVGMTTIDDLPNPLSQFNPELKVSVAAPGVAIQVAGPSGPQGQNFHTDNGTSFAAPLVSATVALLLQREPKLTPAQVKKRLEDTADPPAAAVPDKQLGFGIVNPYQALTAVPPGTPGPPIPPGRAPDAARPSSATVAGKISIAVAVTSVVGLAVATALFAASTARRRRLAAPRH